MTSLCASAGVGGRLFRTRPVGVLSLSFEADPQDLLIKEPVNSEPEDAWAFL